MYREKLYLFSNSKYDGSTISTSWDVAKTTTLSRSSLSTFKFVKKHFYGQICINKFWLLYSNLKKLSYFEHIFVLKFVFLNVNYSIG